MKLSSIEFRAMQSPWRRWGQRTVELPLFRRLGLDVRDKDVLEIGCGSGYGAFLLNRLGPHSYLGLDLMPEQIELARQKYPDYRFEVCDATDLNGHEMLSSSLLCYNVSTRREQWTGLTWALVS